MDIRTTQEIVISNNTNNKKERKTPPTRKKERPPSKIKRDFIRSARHKEEIRKQRGRVEVKETCEIGIQTDMIEEGSETEVEKVEKKQTDKMREKSKEVKEEREKAEEKKVKKKVKNWEKVWKYCTKEKHLEKKGKEKVESSRAEEDEEAKTEKVKEGREEEQNEEEEKEEEKAETPMPIAEVTPLPVTKLYENFEINMRLSRLEEERILTTALRHVVRNIHEHGRSITFPVLEEVDRIQLRSHNLPTEAKELKQLIDQVFRRRGEKYDIENIYRQFVMTHGRITFDSKQCWPASHIHTRHP